ncbi:hypothetical protein [Mucisphaera sp.]|uniref:hypothetical protein n=1 Tax=Mucisphaera sp. TaxID=2913024 RepID=UPI003D0CFC4E
MSWKAPTFALIASFAVFSTGCSTFSSSGSDDRTASAFDFPAASYEEGVNLSSSDSLGFELFGVIELQPDRLAALQQPRSIFGESFEFPSATEFAEVPTD